jgi:hypothetical protein
VTGVLCAGALTGTIAAVPASASSSRLCVNFSGSVNCIAVTPTDHEAITSTNSNVNWSYPGSGHETFIKADNLCLQLNDNGNDVVENGCVDDQAEMWINSFDVVTGRTQFVSQWALTNLPGHPEDCLQALLNTPNDDIVFGPCDFGNDQTALEQGWGTS